MQLLRIIDELETLIERSSGMMGQKWVNEEAFYEKVQKLRSAIPREIKEANDILHGAHRPNPQPLPADLENLTDDEKLRLIHEWTSQWLEVRHAPTLET